MRIDYQRLKPIHTIHKLLPFIKSFCKKERRSVHLSNDDYGYDTDITNLTGLFDLILNFQKNAPQVPVSILTRGDLLSKGVFILC